MRLRSVWVLVAVMVLLLSVLVNANGAEPAEDLGETKGVRYVTLGEALEIAQENSTTLEITRLSLQEAQFSYRQAEAAQIMQPSPTMLLQAQAGLDLARQNYLMGLDSLALDVRSDFYNVLRLQNLLDIAQEGLESAERHEDIAGKKLEVGTATRLDVIRATRSVLDSQAGVSQARHSLELTQMRFRQTLGLPLDAPVLPKDMDMTVEPADIDLADDLAFALENRDEVKQLQAAVEVARKNVELSDNDYTPVLTLEQAKINLAKSELQLRQVKELLALEIRQSYSALRDAEERIPVLQKGVEEAEEMIRLSELSYEADMITSTDLEDARIGLLAARNDYVNAVYDHNLAKVRYDYAVARALRD